MGKRIRTRFFALLAACALLTACAGCAGGRGKREEPADPSLQNVLKAGKLVLGFDAGFPPMGFINAEGEIVGFDIDVAQEVCSRLGITLEKRPIGWGEKEELLNGGEIDCIWNGFSVTAARGEAMTFSDPYMKNEMVFVVRESSAIRNMSELDGASVGVQLGSTAEDILRENTDHRLTVTPMEDNVTLLDELAQGRFDAAFLDSVAAFYCISSGSLDLYVLPGNLGEEEYAIGFRKGDAALRDRVQEILYEMKADDRLGELSEKWFGIDIITLK